MRPPTALRIAGRVVAFERRLLAQVVRRGVRVTGSVVGVPAGALPYITTVLEWLDPSRRGMYPFLSDEWIGAARAIHEELEPRTRTKPPRLKINLAVTNVPFGEAALEAHIDTTSGTLVVELGHIEGADLSVTLPYDVARSLLVDQDQHQALQAIVSGRVTVEGDLPKLLALHAQTVDPIAVEAAARIKAITA